MRSTALRRFAADLAGDATAARARLEEALRAAGGPLVEPLAGAPGSMLVTFVVLGRVEQPYVGCQLVGPREQAAMSLVPGTTDVWWAEAVSASELTTEYQFQTASTPELDARHYRDPDAIRRYAESVYLSCFADPFNHRRVYPMTALSVLDHGEQPPPERWSSVLQLPPATDHPWLAEPKHRGRVETRTVSSTVFANTRTVTTWSPPGVDAAGLPLVVLLDGEGFLRGMDALRIFDNLAEDGGVPPFAVALVHNVTPSSRLTEFQCHPSFPTFVADELLPQLIEPGSARQVALGGYSYGALAACWAAYERPDAIDGVLALSTSLWWSPDGAPGWLTSRYRSAEPKPLRFWIEVGLLEIGHLPESDGTTMLEFSRELRDVLSSKGYDIAGYRERPGGHDFTTWQQALPEALAALLAPVGSPGEAAVELEADRRG